MYTSPINFRIKFRSKNDNKIHRKKEIRTASKKSTSNCTTNFQRSTWTSEIGWRRFERRQDAGEDRFWKSIKQYGEANPRQSRQMSWEIELAERRESKVPPRRPRRRIAAAFDRFRLTNLSVCLLWKWRKLFFLCLERVRRVRSLY